MSSVQDNPVLRTIKNRFPKSCCICKTKIQENEGFACEHLINGRTSWQTYCKAHVPTKIEPKRAEITPAGEVYFPFDPSAVILVKSLAGARFNKDGKFWIVSMAPEHLSRVVNVADKLGLTVPEDIRQTANKTAQTAQQELSQNFDTTGLFPFQVTGACFLQSKDRCLLGDEMGTGKTVQTLASLPKDQGVLIVCPASLKFNWRDEAKRWRPDLTTTVLKGKGSFRFPNKGEMVIVNYDILPETLTNPETPFVLVCDEVHLCKNYKAKRSKAVKNLAKIAAKTIGLTGTPLMNRPFDLFGVLSTLHLEKEVFGSWIGFLRAFNAYKNRFGGYEFGRVAPHVPELLRRVMLRRRREEVLPDLPKKSYTTVTVEGLNKKLVNQLDKLYEECELLLETDELPPFEMFSKIRAQLAESRIDAMLEFVESHEEENIPLVVFSAHRAPIDILANREGWATITGSTKAEERQEIVRQFQSGQLKGIGLTISAGGVGLTLTHAWKTLFVDLDWTPALNAQAEDRICRIGQTKPCEIVRLVSDHVLDQHIHRLIAEKIQLFANAIDKQVVVQKQETAGETDEEYAARLEAMQQELEHKTDKERKDHAASKLERVVKRELQKRGTGFVMPVMTPALVQAIENGLSKMLGTCDGAKDRDEIGFNKPDAFISRWLYALGLDNQLTQKAAYLMLLRYPKQVKLKV
jgi:SWI/SNF-related matrix-associated actin-dependent regulator 1 of chromatin subfamily A